MLTYNIENKGKLPLYEYLFRCIKEDILEGRLKENDKLPSKRKLSSHLKISIITVENAYELLLSQGYIRSVERSGYFVNEGLKQNKKRASKETLETENEDELFADFSQNSIRNEFFPFSVWARLMREVLLDKDKKLLQTAPKNGVFELREAICEHLYEYRGMDVSPENIIIGAGSDYLYNMILQFFGNDKIFAAEDPGYKKIAQIYTAGGAKVEYVSLDKMGISVTELRKSEADIVHISPSHHYPTGIIMPIERRRELLSWANEEEGRFIIEDEYDSEFRFSSLPMEPLMSIDRNEKVIYMNTFSKTISPSIRISYMVLPTKLLKKYKEKLGFYSCSVPSFEQYTLAKFIKDGFYEQHLSRIKNLYRNSRNVMINAIEKSMLKDYVSVHEENAGLHFLLKINTDKTDAQIKALCKEQKIGISYLEEYLLKPQKGYEHLFILNYSGIDEQKIDEALNRIYKAIKAR